MVAHDPINRFVIQTSGLLLRLLTSQHTPYSLIAIGTEFMYDTSKRFE
jgi:hypothetical protein